MCRDSFPPIASSEVRICWSARGKPAPFGNIPLAGPAALGWWQSAGRSAAENWRSEYFALAALLIPLAGWGLRIGPRNLAEGGTAQASDGSWLDAVAGILSQPTIYLLGLAYFLHGVAQSGMVSWVGQLYQRRFSIDGAHAAYFLSIDLAGFFLGRAVLSWLTSRWRISELLLLAICAAFATAAYGATIVAPGYAWGLA